MIHKLGLYTHVATAQLKATLADEEGSEILQVVGMATAVAALLGLIITAAGDSDIGTTVIGAIETWVESLGGGGGDAPAGGDG